jgi:hypothetical protein
LLFVAQPISGIDLYVKFLKTLYVVGGVSVGFWGSTDRRGGIGDAGKIPEFRIIFADFGGTGLVGAVSCYCAQSS